MRILMTSIRVFFTFAISLGLFYPFFIIIVGKIFFSHQANGSFLECRGKIIGSSLIAQEFTSPKYFHSRFSAVYYDARNSGGSNFPPSDKNLYNQVENHIKQIKTENHLKSSSNLPADMMLNSASGLDPHISRFNAIIQLTRVAENRHLSKNKIKQLIDSNTANNFFGIWGESGINVLQLNLALDKLEKTQ